MKNYVQTRLKTKSNKQYLNSIKHNSRHHMDPDDMDNVIHPDEVNYIQIFDGKDNNITQFKNNIKNNTEEVDGLYERLKEFKKLNIKKHQETHLKNKKIKRKLQQDRVSSSVNGIITFSELINNFDFNDKEKVKKFFELSRNSIEEMIKEMDENAELMYLTLHLDEKSPHFHFEFTNFDKKGQSIFRKNRNAESLAKLQDTVGKHFAELGFQRGEKKEITGKNHTQTWRFKEQQIKENTIKNKEIEEKNKELEEEIKKIREEKEITEKKLKDMEKTIKEGQNKMDELEVNYNNILNNFYKKLGNIKDETTNEKETYKEYKKLLENTKKEIEEIRQNIIKRSDIDVEVKKEFYADIKRVKELLENTIKKSKEGLLSSINEEKLIDVLSIKITNTINNNIKKINELIEENKEIKEDNKILLEKLEKTEKELEAFKLLTSDEIKEEVKELKKENTKELIKNFDDIKTKIDLVDFMVTHGGKINWNKSTETYYDINFNNNKLVVSKDETNKHYLFFNKITGTGGSVFDFYKNYIDNKVSFKQMTSILKSWYNKSENNEYKIDKKYTIKLSKNIKKDYKDNEFLYKKGFSINEFEKRKINEETLEKFKDIIEIDSKLSNVYNNHYFLSKNINDEVVGKEVRNFSTGFKSFQGSKSEGLVRQKIGDSDEIFIFESMLDAMSYYQLKREDGIYISTSGQISNNQVELLRDLILIENIKEVNVCFDNDNAGNNFSIDLQDKILKDKDMKFLNFNRIVPIENYKDFNDELKNYKPVTIQDILKELEKTNELMNDIKEMNKKIDVKNDTDEIINDINKYKSSPSFYPRR